MVVVVGGGVGGCWWCGVVEAVVVGVAQGCLGGIDGGWGCVVGGAGDELEGPLAVVEQGVVAAAEQGGVVEIGFSSVLPGGDVVGFAVGGGGLAAGEGAAEVAGVEEFVLEGGVKRRWVRPALMMVWPCP